MSMHSLAGSTVSLVREGTGGRTIRTFRILQEYTRGASVICYTARPAEGGPIGILREFCPADSDTRHYALRRGSDGFLHTAGALPSADENFIRSRDEYTAAYHRVLNASQLREDDLLQSFIPTFEIYYSETEGPEYKGTVFIWTDRVLKTFAELCDEIHKQPASRPEFYLASVLNAVCTLAESIRALHAAGYIHRDIKPSNFGFVRREDQVLTQTLALFDIDSLWDTEEEMGAVVGSEGYMAPETLHAEPDNRADIYSIGATLFTAIIITDRVKENGYHYRSEYFDILGELVDESALIRASEQNSHPRLRLLLTKILSSCLDVDKKQRYRGCRYLIDDLREALSYVLPPELSTRNRAGERWILTDEESAFDRNRRKNSERLFRHHLYERPVYRWMPQGCDEMRVLVLGLGNYAHRFLDAILSMGQLPGKRLCVTVVSSEKSDLDLYLKDRPMLSSVFSINGAGIPQTESFGNLTTIVRRLHDNDPDELQDQMENLLCESSAQYVFIALGGENLNIRAARACAGARTTLQRDMCVTFVWDDQTCEETLPADVYPAFVNADIRKMSCYTEVERMAFNLYALWRAGENLSRSRLRREFRKNYDHESSAAQVMAVRYMLWSVGIDTSAGTFDTAAAAFEALVRKKPEVRLTLACAEHRRWMAEKICAGWTRLTQLSADGVTKNERKKQHLCLVESGVNPGLPENDPYLWEEADENELQHLDGLDRLSVAVHRCCLAAAGNIGPEILDSGTAETIRRMIGESGEASAAFHELRCCMQDIMTGDRDKVRFYRGLCNAFRKSLDTLPEDAAHRAQAQFAEFMNAFAPIAESARSRDFKKDDLQLIDSIPYILTYTPPALAIPFRTGSSTALFSNAAAAIIARPEKIFYLCRICEPDAEELIQAVPSVLRLLRRRHMHPAVEFLAAYSCTGPEGWKKKLAEKIAAMGDGIHVQMRMLHVDDEKEIAAAFTDILYERRVRGCPLLAEQNDCDLADLLRREGFYTRRAVYRFDSRRMEFLNCRRSEWLRYIRTDSCVTAGDLVALGREAGTIETQPQFFGSYRTLWRRYREDPAAWQELCGVLGDTALRNDEAAMISLSGEKRQREYRYILPSECLPAAEQILKIFTETGLASDGIIRRRSTREGEILFCAPLASGTEIDALFGNQLLLLQPAGISYFVSQRDNTLRVSFDHREIRDIPLDKLTAAQMRLLEFFRDAGYIINVRIRDEKLSFTCSTLESKRILTSAERILEIYTYRKLKETVGFDDVRAEIVLYPIGTEEEERLDMAVSCGFRSMVVECRDIRTITPEYCEAFSEMADQAGINSRAVLIADAGVVQKNMIVPTSEMLPNVILITDEKEISDIGHVLLRILTENIDS